MHIEHDTTRTTVLTVTGSLRGGSLNRVLLDAATDLLGPHARVRRWDGLRDVPPFDEDAESGPVPPAVAELRAELAAADALLVATPEYNGSVPGQLKNAIDWASRPYGASTLVSVRAAVIGASPSPGGAARAQHELRHVLRVAGAEVSDLALPVPSAFGQFDERGQLLDPGIRAQLADVLEDLVGVRVDRAA